MLSICIVKLFSFDNSLNYLQEKYFFVAFFYQKINNIQLKKIIYIKIYAILQ